MYHQLTEDFSLFAIPGSYLQNFMRLVEEYINVNTKELLSELPKIDSWGVIFNLWILGEKHNKTVVLKPEKELYFSIDTAMIRILSSNGLYNAYIKKSNVYERLEFSLFLGKNILQWFRQQLDEFGYDIIDFIKTNTSYYLMNDLINYEMDINYLSNQGRMSKKVIEKFSNPSHLNKLIRETVLEIKT